MIYLGMMNHRQLISLLYLCSYLDVLIRRGFTLYSIYICILYLKMLHFLAKDNISWQICNISSYSVEECLTCAMLARAQAFQPTLILRTFQEYSTMRWHAVLSDTENATLIQIDETWSTRRQCFALVYSWIRVANPMLFLWANMDMVGFPKYKVCPPPQ